MKTLLVYPKYPLNFWSLKYSLQFTGEKVVFPPLGLLTVAALLPKEWEKKLVDMNAEPLEDRHLQWADYVFIGAMDIQQKSAIEVINRCNRLGVKVVAGGPFFTERYQEFENVDHLVLGEAETTLPAFLGDLENGTPQHVYMPDEFPDMEKVPAPLWEIANMRYYSGMATQFSRGCPFDCEFCQITRLFGHKVRTKNKEQIIGELDRIYTLGWRGEVIFVDDNFIGNKHKLKTEVLPAMIEWMEKKGYPFKFPTQLSINLADDKELMRMMVRAGFDCVFIGIETVDDDCFVEAGKFQNRNRNLIANVKTMQQHGLEVWAGIIVGFDHDKETIFDRLIKFIQESGITIAMVGILRAHRGTKLYERLKKENRLICDNTGDTVDSTINFIPKMDRETLLRGHKKILKGIYSPEPYYSRLVTFLKEFNPAETRRFNSIYYQKFDMRSLMKTIAKTIVILGILDKGRFYYWKLFFWSLFRQPRSFLHAMSLWVHGYHFRKVVGI